MTTLHAHKKNEILVYMSSRSVYFFYQQYWHMYIGTHVCSRIICKKDSHMCKKEGQMQGKVFCGSNIIKFSLSPHVSYVF
jgi:hypothetical protein